MSEPEPHPVEAPERPSHRRVLLVSVLACLGIHLLLVADSIGTTGIAFDEPAHLAGGFAADRTGDHRLCDTSWLPGRWAALPLLAMGVPPPDASSPAWREGRVFQVGFELLGTELRRTRRLVEAGRLMILALSLAGGLLVFGIARSVHGDRGALLALWLYCLSPTILAHAGLVTCDLAAGLALLAGTWTTWLLLERVSALRLLAGALAVSLALLMKASTLLLLPIGALLASLRLARAEPLPVGRRELRGFARAAVLAAVVACHAAVSWGAIWAFWGFRARASSEPAAQEMLDERWEHATRGGDLAGRLLEGARETGLLPQAWLQAIAHVSEHAHRPAFLLGELSTEGFHAFMPYVFAAKTPLALLALLVLASLARRPRAGQAAWVLVVVYFGVAVALRLSIGHRHLLPIYPALFVVAGGAAAWWSDRRRLVSRAPLLLAGLFAVESLLAAPSPLTFFNGLHVTRRNAWSAVVDSSLDWGQELPRLKRWLDRAPAGEPVYLAYFGTDDPMANGIEARELHSYHPWTYRHGRAEGFLLGPGLYVLSATMYQGLHSEPLPPWTAAAEAEYRRLRATVDPAFDPATPSAEARRLTADPAWRGRYLALHERRFVRLCRWLHLHRPEPDAMATPCYLVWRLDGATLRAALFGPPPFEDGRE